jgi:hypothetical protein
LEFRDAKPIWGKDSYESAEWLKKATSKEATAAVIGIIFVLGGLLFTPAILSLLSLPGELKPVVLPFIRFYATGLFFHYLLINGNGILSLARWSNDP